PIAHTESSSKASQEISLEIQKLILRKVKMLINKVDDLTIEVRDLKIASYNVGEDEIGNVPSLSLKTIEAVHNYDMYLQTDGATKTVEGRQLRMRPKEYWLESLLTILLSSIIGEERSIKINSLNCP
ncbi:unnamed protein product, partial [Allacma fusca]